MRKRDWLLALVAGAFLVVWLPFRNVAGDLRVRDGFLITTAAFLISLLPCLWLVRALSLQRR